MTISTIRKVDADDIRAVKKSAKRFCDRHGIAIFDDDPELTIAYETEYKNDKKLKAQWTRVMCRALSVQYDIRTVVAYGYIGLSI